MIESHTKNLPNLDKAMQDYETLPCMTASRRNGPVHNEGISPESQFGHSHNLGDDIFKVSVIQQNFQGNVKIGVATVRRQTNEMWREHVSGETIYMLSALILLHVLLLVRGTCSFVSTLQDDSFF
jgi:hypothetical protein